MLGHIDYLEEAISELSRALEGHLQPFSREKDLLKTIPGVQERTAEMVIGEIGVNMGVFPTAGHLASFAGICPGNNRSAGKRKPEKTRRDGRWLKPALIEASWAAVRENDSYLSAQYHRLVPHKGKKKAITAVADSMIRIIHHVLEADRPYQDLGPDYFLKRNQEAIQRRCVRQPQQLGYTVDLKKEAA